MLELPTSAHGLQGMGAMQCSAFKRLHDCNKETCRPLCTFAQERDQLQTCSPLLCCPVLAQPEKTHAWQVHGQDHEGRAGLGAGLFAHEGINCKDHLLATRTDVAKRVPYDTFITVYMSDCDLYPRVMSAGYKLVSYTDHCPGLDLKVRLTLNSSRWIIA